MWNVESKLMRQNNARSQVSDLLGKEERLGKFQIFTISKFSKYSPCGLEASTLYEDGVKV